MATYHGRILIADSSETRNVMGDLLEREGFAPEYADRDQDALERVSRSGIDVVLLEDGLPGNPMLSLIAKIIRSDANLPIIVVAARSSTHDAVRAAKAGAFDYLVKPIEEVELLQVLRQAMELRRARIFAKPNESILDLTQWMGRSEVINGLSAEVKRVAATDYFVLISGETGTGKNLVAHAIHSCSARCNGEFITVDCGSIPETLIESELFGHEKGAFTGAHQRVKGAFEAAGGGTLFLDEIGNLPYTSQGKLLRVLEEHQIQRLGSTKQRHLDVRMIAATNADLQKMVHDKTFRADLYHRLSEFTISTPPLRVRKSDLEFLTNHFVNLTCQELGKGATDLTEEAWQAVKAYDWPGNVRELRNVIRRAVLCMDDHESMTPGHLGIPAADGRAGSEEMPRLAEDAEMLSLKEMVRRTVSFVERRYLLKTLESCHGNKAEAARKLKIDYKTIHTKMKEYGIQLKHIVHSDRGG